MSSISSQHKRSVFWARSGIVTPWGRGVEALIEGVRTNRSALTQSEPLKVLPSDLAGIAPQRGFRAYLKQRKAAKLLTPAARLALDAVGQVLEDLPESVLNREELGLFVAVGREPPDEGEAEKTLALSCRDGQLDVNLLATVGQDHYPPLLPLRTLPNMVLGHISIHQDILGENGCWAGDSSAGIAALRSAYWSIVEGGLDAALCCAGDSLTQLGLARDRYRMGEKSHPGEAGAAILLCSEQKAEELRNHWKQKNDAEEDGGHSLSFPEISDLQQPIELCRVNEGFQQLAGDLGAAQGLVQLIANVEAFRADLQSLSFDKLEDIELKNMLFHLDAQNDFEVFKKLSQRFFVYLKHLNPLQVSSSVKERFLSALSLEYRSEQ